ncbi:MAG: Transcriptional regulator, GntR family with aminotransferase domain protein [Myxococcaceae bacterium]|nr:Transcriptional regulator, GntR family with aminotransferase domain protein [Myxococcaceae bacterium]
MKKSTSGSWVPELRGNTRSVYLALVDAIASDIQSGRLSTSDRLPPQRELAKRLKLNYATVSRAYGEAQRRGLIYSRVGQGTFVCRPRVTQLSHAHGQSLVDMTMNLPPEPDDAALMARFEQSYDRLKPRLRELMRYQEFGGTPDARSAGQKWLSRSLVEAECDRLLVCPGAQSGILACMSLLAKPGDVAVCEDLTYPGVRAVAAQLGVRLIGLPMDEQGLSSEALARACAEHHPKLLYCNPTLQNPTTRTISPVRRRELVRIARSHGLSIVEDDAYGVLPRVPLEPFARLAPELTYYISGFAKCLGPGLRVAYLVAPDARRAARLASILRATNVMASPITVALATECVDNGTAEAALLAIRAESIVRQQIAREVLVDARYQTDPEAFHLWLSLPSQWRGAAFRAQLRQRGIDTVTSAAFATVPNPPEALRVSLGGATSRDQIKQLLSLIAAVLGQAPDAEAHSEARE